MNGVDADSGWVSSQRYLITKAVVQVSGHLKQKQNKQEIVEMKYLKIGQPLVHLQPKNHLTIVISKAEIQKKAQMLAIVATI